MSEDPAAEILKQLLNDMGVEAEKEHPVRNLHKRILEQALDNAVKRHGWTVSHAERQRLLNQLDANLFPLTTG